MAVGDFNGDGTLDLAVANNGSTSDLVSVLLGNGDGTFSAAVNYPLGPRPNSVVATDLNSDGILDLAVVDDSGVRVLVGNGDGTFQTTPMSYVAGRGSNSLAVGDFNRDNEIDLAVANAASNDVSILLNDGLWPPSPGGRPYPGSLPTLRARPSAHPTRSTALANRQIAGAALHHGVAPVPAVSIAAAGSALVPPTLPALETQGARPLASAPSTATSISRIQYWPAALDLFFAEPAFASLGSLLGEDPMRGRLQA